ncbi:MAG: TetR/AcrR family transcriptional regulator [Nocardiaceae bacterium]|nr:TetR/AcrR family transcriptional regulator [Nocardiaceae bacterium]
MSQVVRPFRGVPAEERRAVRRAQLIEAMLDVIDRDGMAGLKVSAICQQAGLTERYFYESFANREEALMETFAQFGRETFEKIVAALNEAPVSLPERAQLCASILLAALLDDPRKGRAYVEAIGSESLRDLRMSYTKSLSRLLTDNILFVYELDPETFRTRLDLVTIVFMAGAAELILHWLGGTVEVTREELASQCARMCVAMVDQVVADVRAEQV